MVSRKINVPMSVHRRIAGSIGKDTFKKRTLRKDIASKIQDNRRINRAGGFHGSLGRSRGKASGVLSQFSYKGVRK